VIAAIGTVLAAAYLLWLYQRTSFGEPTAEFAHDSHIHDVEVPEWLAWTPLLVAIVVLGVYPNFLFSVLNPAVGLALQAYK
jgi:NADH-quinone oxidoreductase subunit M